MTRKFYTILVLMTVCFSFTVNSKAQVIVSDSGRVHITGDLETTYRYYYLDIRDYRHLRWMDNRFNSFTITVDSTANDTVTVDAPYVLFKNQVTGVENSIEASQIYTLDPIFWGNAKGYNKKPASGVLEKTMALKTSLPSENGRPQFSLASVKKNAPELLIADPEGSQYMSTRSLISMLVGAYQSLYAQSESLKKQTETLKAAIAAQPATDIRKVVPDEVSNIQGCHPNPFHSTTDVRVCIPQDITTAFLRIASASGMVVCEMPVTERGNATVTLDGVSWSKGVYFCSLITDGAIAGTVKLIKNK
ncbi:MAG: T9SS type A sorting domain-containing protein [Bacteroidaceae bacterium]|nr:T9SS type A sorting domain-containing protein [Bacteroidaceae bacterium]